MTNRIQSMGSLVDQISMEADYLEGKMPGPFVDYDEEKDRSCEVSLASSAGYIKKVKERKLERTVYEFFCLAAWHDLLREYSKVNPLRFKAPRPICLTDINEDKSGIIMTYLGGNKARMLTNMKKNTPVKIKRQKTPLPLYAACALHLGALNRIKDEEGLVHGDYDDRHVIFNSVNSTTIGVIDVENSFLDFDYNLSNKESSKFATEFFRKKSSSEEEASALRAWYDRGAESLVLPRGKPQMEDAIWSIRKKYGVDFDMVNKTINGYEIITNKKE